LAETQNGIEAMRERMERASRRAPPTRRTDTASGGAAAPAASGRQRETAPATPPATRPAQAPAGHKQRSRTRLAPDLPPVNLAIRVRRPLDDRLVDIIYSLRGRGVRTSKVELIEMLLWELGDDTGGIEGIVTRLGRFRAHAPRALASVIPDQ
jgi:hypothetical protein